MASGENTPPSGDLEALRLLLFPQLSPEEGRRRIDAAFDGAADPARARRIEELANDPDLAAALLRRISERREEG